MVRDLIKEGQQTMTLLGVDVSEWQGRPDWKRAKASGLAFAIARAQFGTSHPDKSYPYNRAAIPAAGLVPGAYHFLTSAPAAAQADLFCAAADPHAIHVLDVEYAHLDVPGFVARYRRHYPTKTLLIYTGRDLWTRAAGGLRGAGFGPLWLAGYRPNAYTLAQQVLDARAAGTVEDWHADVELHHADPGLYGAVGALEPLTAKWAHAQAAGVTGFQFAGWSSWTLCQFSDHCAVPGISGGVDGDAFTGTLTQLRALAGTQPAPQPAPTPTPKPTQEADMQPIYVRPDGPAQPGDGYYAVTPSGVHGVTRIEFGILETDPAHRLVSIPRPQWQAIRVLADLDRKQPVDVQALAAAIVGLLPEGAATAAEIAQETADLLASRLAS